MPGGGKLGPRLALRPYLDRQAELIRRDARGCMEGARAGGVQRLRAAGVIRGHVPHMPPKETSG